MGCKSESPAISKATIAREALLSDWQLKSDREIAKERKLSNRTVSQARKVLEQEGRIVPRASSTQTRSDMPASECVLVRLDAIQPADLNDVLYAPVDKSFTRKYGERCWELEALPIQKLRDIVEDAIRSVLDIGAFHQEVEKEKQENTELERVRDSLKRNVSKILRESTD